MALIWEKIDDHFILWRTKVPGGWLVVSEAVDMPGQNSPGVTFVPDSKHEWKLTAEVKARGLEN